MQNSTPVILKVVLALWMVVPCSLMAQQPKDTVVVTDIGRLPESFEMAVDSLLNSRYKSYYSGNRKVVPTASREDYRERLMAMNSLIPLTYNPMVQECIDMYVNKRSTLLSAMLAKSAYYFPILENELDKAGLPLELKYLAIVESALDPTAVSRRGATGLWQFMLTTGKLYGLRIDSLVDERRDPIKSTRAACRYFQDLYAIYRDWLLVIAAYNCGPGNINKAIRKSGGKTDFWQIFPYLPRETRSYVPFFIAAFYSMEHHREHQIRPGVIHMPLATDTVHVRAGYSFADISRLTGVSIDTIRLLNPQYRRDIVPASDGQVIVLPASKAVEYSSLKDKITKDSLASVHTSTSAVLEPYAAPQVHIVRKGETLSKIARKYGVSVTNLRSWNSLGNKGLRVGQKLVVRAEEKMEASATNHSTNATKATKPTVTYHTVKKGETLSGIANKYKGVTVKSLKRENGLANHKIKPGQRLKIPTTR